MNEPLLYEDWLKTMTYAEYLKTDWWSHQKNRTLAAADGRCQVCNSARRLNVHHRTYERVGREQAADLTALCSECHELFHEHKKLPFGDLDLLLSQFSSEASIKRMMDDAKEEFERRLRLMTCEGMEDLYARRRSAH